jgi:hypothetical protein
MNGFNFHQPLQQSFNNAIKSFSDYEIERNIRQTVQQDLLREYDFIISECYLLLNELHNNMYSSLTKDSQQIYLTLNGDSFSEKIDNCEKIQTELGKVLSRDVTIIKDTKNIVHDKRANPHKIYLPLFLIASKIEPLLVFDIYSNIKDNNYSYNLFTYTTYLNQRFNVNQEFKNKWKAFYDYTFNSVPLAEKEYYLKIKDEYFIKLFLHSFTINNSSEYIEEWLTYFFKTLRRIKNNLILIGNIDVSEEIFYNGIIKQIFGFDYCITVTEEILENQTIDSIVQNKLFLHINEIPEKAENQKKLKDLIEGLIVYDKRSDINNYNSIPFLCQIIFTIKEPHPFLNDFLSHSKVFFIDSMNNINLKLNQPDRISLLNNITKNLTSFSTQLAALNFEKLKNIGNIKYLDLKEQEVINKRQIHHSNTININDTVNFKEIDYQTDNEQFKNWLKNPELMRIALSNNSKNPILDPFDNSFESILPKEERYKHTYVTGKTGSGKSELLKTLIYRDILRNDCSVILLDIHGDLAHSVTRLVKDKERLVLIDPILEKDFSPTINLFQTDDKSEENISQLSQMISTIINGINAGDAQSGNMIDILENCIPLVLKSKFGNFNSLMEFMKDTPKINGTNAEKDKAKYIRNITQTVINSFELNSFEKSYFDNDFLEVTNTTRQAVRRRLNKMLKNSIFSNLTNNINTINLEKEMNSSKNKVIVFNIPKAKMLNTYTHYIKFVIGLIQIIALKRADLHEKKRPHTHLYIDEFHNFITPTIEEILTESRKYKLFLTFAHQSVSQIKNANLRDIILDNTNVKIIGKNSNKTLDMMNKTLDTKLKDVSKLKAGEFNLQSGESEIIKIKNTDKLLDEKEYISDEEWAEHKQFQLDSYYRSTKEVFIVKNMEITEATEFNNMINKFIQDIKNTDLSEKSCLYNVKSDELRFEEIVEDFNYEKDDIKQPRIRQQEINLVFQLAFEQDEPIEKIEFFRSLKDKDSMFEETKMMSRNKKYRGENPQEKYYFIPV